MIVPSNDHEKALEERNWQRRKGKPDYRNGSRAGFSKVRIEVLNGNGS